VRHLAAPGIARRIGAVQTATTDPLVGRTLEGRYRIVGRIARGGMSTVYSAVDERLDRLVAVKVMSAGLCADPAFSDRFTREARAAARLSHLNAVSVYDQGNDTSDGGNHVFLVMELVGGRTLRDLIRERGRLNPAEAVSIMEPVLSALSAAHRAGLVHRDIKPENILLSHEGIVKVADFGLARAVESDPSATRTGLMMGTVAYCAPEQITRGRADQRSDVYSAGIVFFELLTGTPPYRGESAMNVAYQHVHSRVPAPSSRVRGIPDEIDELVVSATDSDPAGRPLDAGVFLAELADVRTDLALPVVAVPPSPGRSRPRTSAPPGRPGAIPADIATTDVLRLLGGTSRETAVVSPHPAPARREPPPPVVTPPGRRTQASAPTRHRRRTLILLLVVLLLGAAAGYGGWWFAAGRYSHVPDVNGDSQAVATSALSHAGMHVSQVDLDFAEPPVKAGQVVATDPGAGSRLVRGHSVVLHVSKGPERFKVPSIGNVSQAQAQSDLSAIPVDVNPTPTQQASETVKAGLTIATNPPAGSTVRRNSTVTIIVSSGQPILAIPNIDPGTPYDDAAQRLQDAGFETTRIDDFSDTIPKNGVISIDPTGTARKSTTITLTVSKGPQSVRIPEIAQLTPVAEARAQLERLGLDVKVERAFGGHSGLVVGISPQSGTTVDVGSKVTLTII
jgi:eukaryotic-like serine/threonine-protein kinase